MDESDRSESPDLRPVERDFNLQNYGRFRRVSDLEPVEVTFILFAFTSIVGAAILTVVKIIETHKTEADFTFAVLLLVNLGFILYYTFLGVFRERPFELIVSVVATIIVMLYCIVEYAVKGKNDFGERGNLKLGRLVVVCVLGSVDVVLGSILATRYFQSRNLIFRTVGGNSVLQGMCQTMFAFTAFLKLDLQIVISLLVLMISSADSSIRLNLGEKLVFGLGVPFSIGWVVLGFLMVRFEKFKLSIAFWVLSVLEPAYIIYLFVKTGNNMGSSPTVLTVCIIGAGVVGILVRTGLLVLSYLVTRNFNKGLKEKVYNLDPDNS